MGQSQKLQTAPRLRRYCTCANKKGEIKASPETLKLWGTSAGQQKLKEVLQKHDSFKIMEMVVSKWARQTESDGRRGKWVTKSYLAETEKYTKNHGCVLASDPPRVPICC